MPHDDSIVADKWIQHYTAQESKESDETAVEILDNIVRMNMKRALSVMNHITQKTSDKTLLATLGAGPLEDFLHYPAAADYIDEIMQKVRQDKNWRFALCCVWTTSIKDKVVVKQIENAKKLYFPKGAP